MVRCWPDLGPVQPALSVFYQFRARFGHLDGLQNDFGPTSTKVADLDQLWTQIAQFRRNLCRTLTNASQIMKWTPGRGRIMGSEGQFHNIESMFRALRSRGTHRRPGRVRPWGAVQPGRPGWHLVLALCTNAQYLSQHGVARGQSEIRACRGVGPLCVAPCRSVRRPTCRRKILAPTCIGADWEAFKHVLLRPRARGSGEPPDRGTTILFAGLSVKHSSCGREFKRLAPRLSLRRRLLAASPSSRKNAAQCNGRTVASSASAQASWWIAKVPIFSQERVVFGPKSVVVRPHGARTAPRGVNIYTL